MHSGANKAFKTLKVQYLTVIVLDNKILNQVTFVLKK